MNKYFYDKIDNLYFEISPSEYAISPREDSNAGHFYTFVRNYESPDKEYGDFKQFMDAYGIEESDERTVKEEKENVLKVLNGGDKYWAFPVDMYEHGGISYSVSEMPTARGAYDCDTSHYIGLIVFDREECKNQFGIESKEGAFKEAQREVSDYNRWVNNEDIYQVIAFDKDANNLDTFGDIWSDDPEAILDYAFGGMAVDISADVKDMIDLGEHNSIREAIFYNEHTKNKNRDMGR